MAAEAAGVGATGGSTRRGGGGARRRPFFAGKNLEVKDFDADTALWSPAKNDWSFEVGRRRRRRSALASFYAWDGVRHGQDLRLSASMFWLWEMPLELVETTRMPLGRGCSGSPLYV